MKPQRILLIHEDGPIRSALVGSLRHAGHTVRVADDLRDARRRLREESFHAVLYDAAGAGAGAVEALDSLRAVAEGSRWVALGGRSADSAGGTSATDDRADAVLPRPVNLHHLRRLLATDAGADSDEKNSE